LELYKTSLLVRGATPGLEVVIKMGIISESAIVNKIKESGCNF